MFGHFLTLCKNELKALIILTGVAWIPANFEDGLRVHHYASDISCEIVGETFTALSEAL